MSTSTSKGPGPALDEQLQVLLARIERHGAASKRAVERQVTDEHLVALLARVAPAFAMGLHNDRRAAGDEAMRMIMREPRLFTYLLTVGLNLGYGLALADRETGRGQL